VATVYRVTAVWTGFQGAPGYSKFSFSDLTTDAARNAAAAGVRAYFMAVQGMMHTAWTISIQSLVQEYDMATGALTGESTISTVPAAVTGGDTPATWSGGTGFFVGWRTGVIYLGRRIQGRTFHVPAVNCFSADGTLSPAAITMASAAADGLIAVSGAEFCIWARQFTKPTPPAKPVQIGGALAPVTGKVVKDQASQLRSRRT